MNQFNEGDFVKLNVGGQGIETTLETLTKIKGSKLERLFSNELDLKKDFEGRVMIDADPSDFRGMLNYLRSGRSHLPDQSEKTIYSAIEREIKRWEVDKNLMSVDFKLDKRATAIVEEFKTKPKLVPSK